MAKYLKIRCGTTRRGLPIYETSGAGPVESIHPEHLQFDSNDHIDAQAVFLHLGLTQLRAHPPQLEKASHYDEQAKAHRQVLEERGCYQVALNENRIISIFDLLRLGRQLIWPGNSTDSNTVQPSKFRGNPPGE